MGTWKRNQAEYWSIWDFLGNSWRRLVSQTRDYIGFYATMTYVWRGTVKTISYLKQRHEGTGDGWACVIRGENLLTARYSL